VAAREPRLHAVYDYVAGKLDWLAMGLPSEGLRAEAPRAGDVARVDVPTCSLGARVGEIRTRAGDWNTCFVVNEERVVLGRVRGRGLTAPDQTPVEEVMDPGPRTIRPSVAAAALPEWMRQRRIATVIVTTSDGRLVGLIRRDDLEAPAARP
jgi:hypothetical protein